MSLLEVEGLSVVYGTDRGPLQAVSDVSLAVERGEVVGIVGESGCGKSTLAMSVLRLVKPPGKIVAGAVRFEGEDLFRRRRASMRELRGRRISLIPQAAMNALDPMYTARALVAEVIRAHRDVSRTAAKLEAGELLRTLGIAAEHVDSFPHELSGGMRQRVTIAMAIANDPSLVVADEPVTGLDVIVQAQILSLLRTLGRDRGLAMIFISHDIMAVSSVCDRLAVMYAGRIVEEGPASAVVSEPRHPYTRGLIASLPTLDGPSEEVRGIPGDVPDLVDLPQGCAFASRCVDRIERCAERPQLIGGRPGRAVACHVATSLAAHVASDQPGVHQ